MSVHRRLKNITQQYGKFEVPAYVYMLLSDEYAMRYSIRAAPYSEAFAYMTQAWSEKDANKFGAADAKLKWINAYLGEPADKVEELLKLRGTPIGNPAAKHYTGAVMYESLANALGQIPNYLAVLLQKRYPANRDFRFNGVSDFLELNYINIHRPVRFFAYLDADKEHRYAHPGHLVFVGGEEVLRATISSYLGTDIRKNPEAGKQYMLKRLAHDAQVYELLGDDAPNDYNGYTRLSPIGLSLGPKDTGAAATEYQYKLADDYVEDARPNEKVPKVFLSSEDFKSSKKELIIPWLAKVVNAWLKVCDKLPVPQFDLDAWGFKGDDYSSESRADNIATYEADVEDTLAEYGLPHGKRSSIPFSALFTIPTRNHSVARAYVNDYMQRLLMAVIHRNSLYRLHTYLPSIINWVSDPKVKVDLLNLSVGEAVRRSKAYAREKLKYADVVTPESILFKYDNYQFVELTTEPQLVREGECQSHCVGGYWDAVQSGRTQIVSMRTLDNKRIATIEVERKGRDGKPVLQQVQGKANTNLADPQERQAVVAFSQYIGATFGSGGYQDLEHDYARDLLRYTAMQQQQQTNVLAGLWALGGEGISEFIRNFGRR